MLDVGRILDEGDNNAIGNKKFIGVVIDNKHPENKKGWVKVRCPDLHKNIPDKHIPWIRPSANVNPAGGNSVGGVKVPALGTKLHFSYQEDNMYFGEYHGSADTDDVVPKEFNEGRYGDNYPDVEGSVDKAGNLTATDAKDGTFEYHHNSGTRIHIDGKGHVTLDVSNAGRGKQFGPEGFTLTVIGDVNIAAKGNVTITATKKLVLAALDLVISARNSLKLTCAQANLKWASGLISTFSEQGTGNDSLSETKITEFKARDVPDTKPLPADSIDL